MANSIKEIIICEYAPKAVGPYSLGVRSGGLVFLSGQLGLDPATQEFVPGGIEEQTARALQNITNILETQGLTLDHVVKTTVFIRDMAEFSKMNAVYGSFFKTDPPARSTVEVSGLPKNGLVEIEVTAVKP
jgi:2-iminobutanoate/2-iminopropanoate deaminase